MEVMGPKGDVHSRCQTHHAVIVGCVSKDLQRSCRRAPAMLELKSTARSEQIPRGNPPSRPNRISCPAIHSRWLLLGPLSSSCPSAFIAKVTLRNGVGLC